MEICKYFLYISETADNVQKISKEEVRNLFEILSEADCLVLVQRVGLKPPFTSELDRLIKK